LSQLDLKKSASADFMTVLSRLKLSGQQMESASFKNPTGAIFILSIRRGKRAKEHS
jgi:hypothetical protein